MFASLLVYSVVWKDYEQLQLVGIVGGHLCRDSFFSML